MVDIEERVQQAVEEITGNEALLEMLDTEAANELLEWGKSMVISLVRQTAELDDAAAEAQLEARLKAVRQVMRATGNWAAGKYTDPEDRVQLREKLLGNLQTIHGADAHLPTADELDSVLNPASAIQYTPQQQILNLKQLINEAR